MNVASGYQVLDRIINVHVYIHLTIFVFDQVVIPFHKSGALVLECGNIDKTDPSPALFLGKKSVVHLEKIVINQVQSNQVSDFCRREPIQHFFFAKVVFTQCFWVGCQVSDETLQVLENLHSCRTFFENLGHLL